jgi:hypothetical protein
MEYKYKPLVEGKDFENNPQVKREFVLVRFEVFAAMAMKNGVFWDVTPCGSCKNRRFGGT